MIERNGSGYVSPTETTGIYRASRGITDSYTAPAERPKTQIWRDDAPKKDTALFRARQMFNALCAIAAMEGFTIADIVLKDKISTDCYKKSGVTVERMGKICNSLKD